jgi:uncharacterized repeat protein (TIGR03806 family)
MYLSRKKNKPLLILLCISIFAIIGAAPYFLGPGLTQAEPIGTFLNGNFSDVTTASNLYRPAFPNLTFDSPLTFNDVPNSNVLIVGQRNGEIYWFENDETVTTKNLLADLSNDVGVVWDGGFLGLAIHPQFGTPGKNYFYVYYTSKDDQGRDYPDAFLSGFGCYREDYWGGFLYLKRYEVNPSTFALNLGSELTMLKMRMFSSTHRGGSMDFGNDGFLYLATGEQSAYTKPQNITTNLDGGVIRIDVDEDPAKSHTPIRLLNNGNGNWSAAEVQSGDPENGEGTLFTDEISGVGYGIPNDNPFLSPSGDNFEEYYTIGHRNPHRMTKDVLTGTFYIGEIGGGQHEEVNVVEAGKNYGWPVFEGNGSGPGANCEGVDAGMYNNMPHEGPLVEFPRTEANAIIGGYVYRGTDIPEFYGKYICADYGIGEEIWAVDTNTGNYDLLTAFSPTNIIGFGEDNYGELYLLSQGNNVFLYKLVPTDETPEAPLLLSQTGAFQDLATLTPNSGILPYDLIEPFWSDGAEKKRWMAIPNDGTHNTADEQISFSEDGDWEFPVGSVLIKHFEMPIDESDPSITKRLETRFSIKASTGNFYFLTYKWNNAQTDAVLLDSGLEENIEITTTSGTVRNQTWNYPSNQDCISCHNPATNGTLGTKTRYLNSNITYPQTSLNANQLVTLSHLGILDEPIDDATVLDYQTYKAADDPSATLDEKARSYLDLNCAYCHRPGGTGDRAQFDLRLSNSLLETGLMFAGTNTPIGVPGERIVVAGDAANSILFHRTESVDETIAMPPIAKNVVDQEGVDLVEEWINQLDPNFEDPTINPSTYTITNVGSGLVMDIEGSSQADFADVIQMTNALNDNQKFVLEIDEDNYYSFKSVHSNKYVDVRGQGQAEGTNLIQYRGNGTVAQFFALEYLGNDEYAIRSKANNLYIGVENNAANSGASLKTYSNDGSDFFKWTFTDVLRQPKTYTYDNGWLPSNPSYANTFIDDSIVVNAGEAVISRNTKCDDLTINSGATVIVNNDVTLSTATTTLRSTSQSYSSLIVDGTIEGAVKYERYVNPNSGGNDLISPPLSGQTWESFLLSDSNATDMLNDGNDNPRTYLFGPFDKATDWYVNYTDEVITTLNSGAGYRAATLSGTTLTFTGTVLTTPVSVDIVHSGTNYVDWNLIGNPYPSYISITDFLNYEIAPNVKNIDILEDISGIYGYDGNASNGWDVITLANAGNRLMAPGQGFFVSADVTHIDDYDIIFDTSMRVTGSDDDFIAGRNTNELTFLKLNASTANNNYTTEFYFNDNASQGLDAGFDGKILGNTAPDFAIYSHLVQDNTGLPIALQALNPSDLTNTTIPLGVNANQGEQITFSISESTLPSDIEVYLEDNVANTVTLLNSGDYILTPNADLNGTGRFYLRVTSSVLSVVNNELDTIQIYTSTKPKLLNIKGELNDATMLNLYDIQGRLVLNKMLDQSSLLNTVDISSIGSGVYFVKVFSDSKSKTQKVIIQ